jgi:hypothetical protein
MSRSVHGFYHARRLLARISAGGHGLRMSEAAALLIEQYPASQV